MMLKRKIGDIFKKSLTIISSLILCLMLFSIIFYVISKGIKTLNFNLLISDYNEKTTVVSVDRPDENFTNPNLDNTFFSYAYGISLADDVTIDNKPCVKIMYIAADSPFNSLNLQNAKSYYKARLYETLDVLIGEDIEKNDILASSSDGAEAFCSALDETKKITYLQCITLGGGIRGSIITTLYLIILTLIFLIPLSLGASIYLSFYAKDGKFKTIINSMIEATSGIPSLIFGFVGSIVFIKLISLITKEESFSLLAGALTLTILLIPVVIKTMNEAFLSIPKSYMEASLALGATTSQTVFKVMLPVALPSILISVILSIGRIIGESAALIFVTGTAIKDNISIMRGSTSLSLHIWSIVKEEVPNYEVACSISIIILICVFTMNTLLKLISKKINQKRGQIDG